MNRIEVVCENGHRLNASRQMCGTIKPCPKCGVNVKIPMLPLERSSDPLSDTGVMRILGTQDALPAPPTHAPMPQTRSCPRCEASIDMTTTVCNRCQCYIGAMPNFLKRL